MHHKGKSKKLYQEHVKTRGSMADFRRGTLRIEVGVKNMMRRVRTWDSGMVQLSNGSGRGGGGLGEQGDAD